MLQKLPAILGRTFRHARPGIEKLSYFSPDLLNVPELIRVTSPSFNDYGMLPERCTGDSAGLSPALQWWGVPISTATLTLLVEDADSPTPQPLVHGIVYGLPGYDAELQEGAFVDTDAADEAWILGRNSLLNAGWLPPDPPPGHGRHRYAFQFYALDETLALSVLPGRRELLDEMHGHVIAKGCLLGVYERD